MSIVENIVVGKSVRRTDILDKVLGRSKYADDLEFPNILYAKLLRSKFPHARIINIDISEAESLSGVKSIITAEDVPVNTFGIQFKDQVILASDKVRYLGDPVVAVAAESVDIAEEAIELINIEYEELPGIFLPQEALKAGAPKVHDGGNLCAYRKIRSGDVEKGFKISDEIIEDSFSTQKIQHCHIEPRAGIAIFDANRKLTIWSSLPVTFVAQTELARVLSLPITKVRIIQTECGGSFGGRNEISLEPYIALLAMRTRRPVKMVWSREEEFIGSTTRHSFNFEYKTGVKKDGSLIAREVRMISDTGAYSSFGESALTKACILACGPYTIPNIKVDGYSAFTNNPVGGAMRGFGAPQAFAAEETHMDNIASHLGIDPITLRLKNAVKIGDRTATGQILHSVGLTETIKKAAESARWNDHRRREDRIKVSSIKRGKGIACMFYPVGLTEKQNASAAIIKVNVDGTMNVYIGALDVGQGSRTVLAQIAAEEMGIPFGNVSIVTGDTDYDPYDFGSCASRVTYATGNAVRFAVAKAKKILLEVAAEMLNVNTDALETNDGMIYVKRAPQKCTSMSQVVSICQKRGKPITTTASFNPPNMQLDPETGQGNPYPTYVYATQIADVSVNEQTGLVKVLKIVAAHDVGKAINPALVRGQIIGGIGFGLGQALMENMVLTQGRNMNPNFLDYLIPASVDMPDVETIIIEEYEPTGPFGAKGVAEPSSVPTIPAILNAIYDAVGVRINDLPVTPEKVLKALKEKRDR